MKTKCFFLFGNRNEKKLEALFLCQEHEYLYKQWHNSWSKTPLAKAKLSQPQTQTCECVQKYNHRESTVEMYEEGIYVDQR